MQIWTRIMTDVAADPHMSANVIFDILNEPDSYGLTWLGSQLGGHGLGYWYHQIMSVGYGINPSAAPPQRSCSAQQLPRPCCCLMAESMWLLSISKAPSCHQRVVESVLAV